MKVNNRFNRKFIAYIFALSIILAPVSARGMSWFSEPIYKNIPYVQDMHDSACKYFGVKDLRSSLESAHEKINNIYASSLIKTSLRLYITDYLSRGAVTRFLINSCFEQRKWWMQLGMDILIGTKHRPLEEIALDCVVGYMFPAAITGDFRLPYEYAKELGKSLFENDTQQ